MIQAREKFEGSKVYLGHNEDYKTRDPLSFAGTLTNMTIKQGELYGDLEIQNKAKWDAISSIADSRPDVFGLSIEADAFVDKETETQVYGFEKAGIVALVDNPATVKSLFESKTEHKEENEDVNIKEITVKSLKEQGAGSELLKAFEDFEAQIAALKALVLGDMPEQLAPVAEQCQTTAELIKVVEAWKKMDVASETAYSIPVKEQKSTPEQLRAELLEALNGD